MIIAILLLASPVSAFFSFGFSMSQSRAVAGATVASEIIADTMVSNYIDENHPEYSDEYTVVSLIFDPTGKIIGKLSSKGVKYANGIYEYSKKSNKGKDIVDSDTLNKIFDKELIEELAKKENKGYSSKTVAKNTVELLEEGVEPENINKLFKDAVKEDKKLGWMDNRIKNLKDDGIKTSTINNIIKNSNKPNDALKKVAGETNKLSKMGISKSSIFRITKNANNVDDITKQRKIIGKLKQMLKNKNKVSKKKIPQDEVINELIEKEYDINQIVNDLKSFNKLKIIRANKYKVRLFAGNVNEGLDHVWLRHVVGYNIENEKATTIFPMGQKIKYFKNNKLEVKNIQQTISSPKELKEIIIKAVRDNKNKFNGGNKVEFSYYVKDMDIRINLVFLKGDDGSYYLQTAYPINGKGVEKYIPNVGWFKYNEKSGKWEME